MSTEHVKHDPYSSIVRTTYHAESESDANERAILKTFVLTLVALKVVTSAMILYVFPSMHALVVVLALSLMWLIAGVTYGGAYSRIKFRLLKARARRRQLLHQEWNVD